MKIDLDEALCRDFPNLYADRHARGSCMVFGLSVGDGWEPLIRKLSERLEQLILEVPEDKRESYRASQVKEKFGSLRFYMTASSKEMEDAITLAEDECSSICEECGEPGKIRHLGWSRTNCDACDAAYNNARMARNPR